MGFYGSEGVGRIGLLTPALKTGIIPMSETSPSQKGSGSMSKRTAYLLVLIIAAVGLVSSCILDPKEKPPDDTTPPTRTYQDLTERDHVLNNLELAYNEKKIDRYEELLDSAFVFYFSPADYNDPDNPTDVSWDRGEERRSANNIFSGAGSNPVEALDLRLSYPDENWTAIDPDDLVNYPDQTWYYKSVVYNLSVETQNGTTYKGIDLKAAFIIRQVVRKSDGKQIWQIMRWRDNIEE